MLIVIMSAVIIDHFPIYKTLIPEIDFSIYLT